MIIGNNNNFDENKFKNKMNSISQNNKINKSKINVDTHTLYGSTNATNKSDMYNKSFEMLQDRLKNGTITLDEFNRKCKELEKLRRK